MSDRLSIQSEMRAFDNKDRSYYDSLTDVEKKKFSTFLMMKYGGNVDGILELQEYYLRAHNERVNRNFFDVSSHPKLQWLLCTTVSPSMGKKQHYWLTGAKSSRAREKKFIQENFGHLNTQEVELMLKLNTRDQLVSYARNLGWDDKRIRDEL